MTRGIGSRSFFFKERQERFAHVCSFLKRDMSSLSLFFKERREQIAYSCSLKWAILSERANSQPVLLTKKLLNLWFNGNGFLLGKLICCLVQHELNNISVPTKIISFSWTEGMSATCGCWFIWIVFVLHRNFAHRISLGRLSSTCRGCQGEIEIERQGTEIDRPGIEKKRKWTMGGIILQLLQYLLICYCVFLADLHIHIPT